ncbi:hypothetical protein M409DRAFT_27889 [Zasmidium cellare ATCC 36951]|uniref:Uncharacterized protein n=1 Tax=Zasmidium cellare ATCC 36951 TaxID=1080233 RepID=A0A6A6C4H9_ZASCE|nr:uncharacterized protein M409DRAFT_27889 [Zasmidium cellare ATCC 36951]KAF2161833.1 hypothetical protein M409DRAFT_27889 [Zasmidium cellare ATCC 36951]
MPSSSKFQPLHPRTSLRRIKTAFTPSSPTPSTTSASPLSTSRLSNLSFGNMSSLSVSSAFNSRRAIRRKKSVVELEQEEERSLVGDELMSLVEPRPSLGLAYGGIEEVLGGEV